MVYYKNSLECCHELTPNGKEAWQKMLEVEADEILFKHQHPFKWFAKKLKDFIYK